MPAIPKAFGPFGCAQGKLLRLPLDIWGPMA